ncbi:MAG: hypothetical protein JSW39_04925 [Desulfobacterales bacterium]|nr:MAG: hypothetical protein JSW39_04925 [Desulfobacterales bacterium]
MKRLLVFLLKAVYLLPFFLFGAWLLQTAYFPQFELKESLAVVKSPAKEDDVFGKILNRQEAVPRGHFHIVDEYIAQPEPNPPICLTCHGTYPHSKNEKVRSLLNFHNGFIACAVCHARRERGDENIDFAWVDRNTGSITTQVVGEYGKYSAKIFPIVRDAGGQKKIFRPVDEEAARQFLKLKAQFTPDQIAQAKVKLHDHITTHPVFCSDCHQKDGYLNFAKLGFPRQRIDHLNSTEVVGLVAKYKTFYIPSQIDFGVEKPLQ